MAMTDKKVLFSVEQIARALNANCPGAIVQQQPEQLIWAAQVGHLLWMCQTIPLFLQEGRREKAMRWLGFLQGVCWVERIRTIEELKRDNMPEDSDL